MTSTKSVVDFHCNAFVEFCIQANDEEKRWLNKVFGNKRAKTRCEFVYEKKSDTVSFRMCQGDRRLKVFRNGFVLGDIDGRTFRIIGRYLWTKRDDLSVLRLTREVLVSIYSHLKDPDDMWAFMRVNRMFYSAGCFYSGYAEKITRLLVYGDPFWYIFDQRKRFFTLCFVSDRRDIEYLIGKAIKRDIAEDIIDYCFKLCGLDYSLQAYTYVLSSGEVRINYMLNRGNLLGGKVSRFGAIRYAIKKALL